MGGSIEAAVFHPRAKKILDLALTLYKATNIDDIITELAAEVTDFLKAEHVRLFAYNAVDEEVYTKEKLSDTFVEFRFPVDENSVAGYTALHQQVIGLDDVNNPEELAKFPGLRYDNRYERKAGVKVKSILSIPILENESDFIGIIQLVNMDRPVSSYASHIDFMIHLGKVIASFLFHHDERQRRATKFDYLLEEGHVSQEELTQAISTARENLNDPIKGDVVSVLMDQFGVPAKAMQVSLSRYYLTDFLPYDDDHIIPPEIFKGFNLGYFQKNFVIPLARQEDTLRVLMDNPFNSDIIRDLKSTYQTRYCQVYVGFRKDILKYINQSTTLMPVDDLSELAELEVLTSELDHAGDIQDEDILNEDAPLVVKVVNKLILDAYEQGVSDIHVEPGLNLSDTVVRFRRDGVCFQHTRLPASISPAIISRIKVMASLRLEEHRFPQSGKIRLKYDDSVIELRVETTPTVGKLEDVVLRILAGGTFLSIEELDLSDANQATLQEMIAKPYGILLAVGPTGSGKTTTMHAILHHLNTVEKKILTVEDPVEITQPGLRQVQVNLNLKPEPFDFARAMRSFLRADPDIIMVGEMRDKETAVIAVEAALTGHLVLSTLHTNSAPETITRLIEMGIDPINVADSLLGVLAQRLVRVLCPDCKTGYKPDDSEIEALTAACGREYASSCGLENNIETLFRSKGCEECSNTGFRGRRGLYELLPATPEVKQAIFSGQPMSAIRAQALADGMRTLKMDGIRRVINGQTTLAEVMKVCID